MNISKLLNYVVIETNDALVIAPERTTLGNPGAVYLIIADMPTCCEYLARYTSERITGSEPKTSHRRALRGANVLAKGDLDKPTAQ